MKLPQPKVTAGDSVMVLNYRSKRKDGTPVWERGVCTTAELRISRASEGHTYKVWNYNVLLDRKSASRKKYGQERGCSPVTLYVGNKSVYRNNF